MMPIQRIVLCEGYYDRAFWKGLLLRLGCEDARNAAGRAVDPWGRPVAGGQYAYRSRSEAFIRVVPCGNRCDGLAWLSTR